MIIPPNARGARVIQVIEVTTLEGKGIDGDPCREVKTYHALDGECLAYFDPVEEDRRSVPSTKN